MSELKIGEVVMVKMDPDNDIYQGCVGRVEAVDVECAAGPGVILNTLPFGRVRASYDMLERAQ